MKNKLNILLIILTITLISSCNSKQTNKQNTLSVTISPQQYFLEQIVGDKYEINCVVPTGSNPESADFTPMQMVALNNSIAYFKIGFLGIENTLIDKISQSNPDIKIINCSEGIELMDDSSHVNCDDHSHNSGHMGGVDPHTWSSPKSAKIIADKMYSTVVELDKANEELYTKNYNKLIAEINNTDSIIKSYIAKAPSKAFIIYHPALSYFANEYGLRQYTIEYDGKNPNPSQLKALIDKAKQEGIKVIFIQQEYDTKNAETIANAIGAKTIPINLLSYNWSDEMIKIAKALSEEQ